MSREPSPRRGERGAVTAEAAMVLPAMVAVTAALVWVLSLVLGQVRVVDAAREGARVAARGDGEAAAVAAARRVAPSGATVSVVRSGDTVTVTVTARLDGPGGVVGSLPGAEVAAHAVAAVEVGV